jgi:sialidase-1
MIHTRQHIIVPIVLLAVFSPTEGSGQKVVRNVVVYEEAGQYMAWPSIVRTGPKELGVFFCRTEEHLGPDGAILSVRSTDNGRSWLLPGLAADTPLDDRECGVTILSDGRLLLHLWSTCFTRTLYDALPPDAYEAGVLRRWKAYVVNPRYREAAGLQGAWGRLSSDGGRSWSDRIAATDAVHGGVQLRDGSLLCASYRTFRDSIGIFHSAGLPGTWGLRSVLPSPRPDSVAFGEPHILQLRSGRIVMMMRATAKPYNDMDPRCVLWETTSDDGGRTWIQPYPTPLWGFPPHLLLLSDGRVLCTYGYRRPPFGQRACISDDGVRWDPRNEVILRSDAPNGDLGYPASVELSPDTILTVYYQPNVPPGTFQRMKPPDPRRTKPAILGTVWTVH